jgi:hypothetical protein
MKDEYRIKLLNRSKHILHLIEVLNEDVFCAVVDVNEKDYDFYIRSEWLSSMFLQAARSLAPNARIGDLSALMIKSIRRILIDNYGTICLVPGVPFAAAIVSDKLFVRTAGDFRVHLIRENEVIKVTRDHDLVDDPDPDSPLRLDLNNTPVSFYKSIPTSGITASNDTKEPESFICEIEK